MINSDNAINSSTNSKSHINIIHASDISMTFRNIIQYWSFIKYFGAEDMVQQLGALACLSEFKSQHTQSSS